MKYLRKFATEAEVLMADTPNVVLAEDTKKVLYNIKSNGVYIQHINGNLYITSEWSANGFANDEANGIAIISDEASFVMAKSNVSNSGLSWGGRNKAISGIATATAGAEAIKDFNGFANTTKIIEQLNGYTYGGVTGAPAAEACVAYVFPNGKRGYLPSMGEWRVAYKNSAAVIEAMHKIGAEHRIGYYWTSTQEGPNSAWDMYWEMGSVMNNYKDTALHVRAFTTL